MPKIEKAERRDARRRKERDNATQGVRTATLRAGLGLLTMEVRRKTKVKKRK
jgi:hypothetical protein